jgi:predicted nuclease of predicted toxin-antitoxin system
LKLLADENIESQLVRGLLRRQPYLEVISTRDAGLLGWSDPDLLQWASDQGYVVIKYDVSTMPNFAYKRVEQGNPMPGVIAIRLSAPIRQIIEDLLIVLGTSLPGELEGQVVYLPL